MNDKHKILISNLIYFCKLEEIDYTQILEIEVIQNREVFQIIVNKGTNENVVTFDGAHFPAGMDINRLSELGKKEIYNLISTTHFII